MSLSYQADLVRMTIDREASPRKRHPTRRVSFSEHLDNIQMSPMVVTTATNVKLTATEDDDEDEEDKQITNYEEDEINEDADEEDNAEPQQTATRSRQLNCSSQEEVSFLKKFENFISILIIIFEHFITSIVTILPDTIIEFFTIVSKHVFSYFSSDNKIYDDFIQEKNGMDSELIKTQKLKNAVNFEQICNIHGFKSESHLVKTEDGFQLTLHRINPRENGFEPNGQCVYFQHGLLMTSDVWCVMLKTDDNLPFKLCQLGYDVYLGNNRGNKYSNKHNRFSPSENKFWDFSIDEFALYDIPANINYILQMNSVENLIYIGFSQGTSQILSSISINNDLNQKISKLVLIAPATTPKKLSNWLINSIVNFRPSWIYTLFGKKILMKSVLFWRKITYPPMFIKLIDLPNDLLFNWKSENIEISQKLISYYHLYSTTSVKCVVHWFQIIKSKKFQMYQDNEIFQPFEYPTSQTIKIKKLLLIFGMNDSLVDIDIIISQLPRFRDIQYTQIGFNGEVTKKSDILSTRETIQEISDGQFKIYGIEKHEHLDLLWGQNQKLNVIDNVIEFLN